MPAGGLRLPHGVPVSLIDQAAHPLLDCLERPALVGRRHAREPRHAHVKHARLALSAGGGPRGRSRASSTGSTFFCFGGGSPLQSAVGGGKGRKEGDTAAMFCRRWNTLLHAAEVLDYRESRRDSLWSIS